MLLITVNSSTCIGCGLCASLAPKTFKLSDAGKAEVLPVSGGRDPDGVIRRAAESCPMGAIKFGGE